LTPAQQRELLAALRVHPGLYRPSTTRVAARLCTHGVLQHAADEPEPAYRLTPVGMDQAARLSAQRVIDAVNARDRARRIERQPHAALQGENPAAGDVVTGNEASEKPGNWPFPVSAHDW